MSPKKAGDKWTKTDTQQIGVLARKGKSTPQIARKLGRTEAAVRQRASHSAISLKPKDRGKK